MTIYGMWSANRDRWRHFISISYRILNSVLHDGSGRSYRKCAVVMVTLWLGNNSICDTVCAIQLCNISLTLCVCDTAHNSGFVSIQTPLYLTVGTLWRSETMLCLICETFILFFSAEFADKKQQLRWLQCESERETARERMQGVCEDTMRRWRTETAAALKIIQT